MTKKQSVKSRKKLDFSVPLCKDFDYITKKGFCKVVAFLTVVSMMKKLNKEWMLWK